MTTAADLVSRAKTMIREITPQELSSQLGKVTVIDVREPEEYMAGHLPGAINIPRGLLEFRVDNHPVACDRDCTIALQCQSGGRSALATVAMQELGYKNVTNLAGGFAAWSAAGLPVERD
ncbi:MAG TPA: rhodanese-like domain-containing protein [Gammaproteobacteria bacterium]|nr:rhodanese-like domain-containing protein [Gammaproteobacteria bacterium]